MQTNQYGLRVAAGAEWQERDEYTDVDEAARKTHKDTDNFLCHGRRWSINTQI
jgi:hypothetical protein